MNFKRFLAFSATFAILLLAACCASGNVKTSSTETSIVTESETTRIDIAVNEENLGSVATTTATENSGATSDIQSSETETLPDVDVSILPIDSSFSVHFIDVGQADATLVQCDGEYMLIDGGNAEDSNLIYSVLEKDRITNLDIVVGTHAHEDHIGGLSGALQYATADVVLSPVTDYDSKAFQNFKEYAEEKSTGLTVPKTGDTYSLGCSSITILGVNSTEDTNDTSIVLMVEYGETSFLFTGDAEYNAEQVILASGADLSCDVLKVGHHGSYTSTSYVWLNAIMPKYAVISVGEGNTYNHPTDDTLSKFRDADVKTYRTDLNGDIYAYSDGKTVTMSVAREASVEAIFTAGNGVSVQKPQTTTTTENPEQKEEFSYVLNTNSMKFHILSCTSAEKISDKNKKEYEGTKTSSETTMDVLEEVNNGSKVIAGNVQEISAIVEELNATVISLDTE